jgi:hypothetical protein
LQLNSRDHLMIKLLGLPAPGRPQRPLRDAKEGRRKTHRF